MYDALLEKIATWATGPRFEAAVSRGRDAFFDRFGRVNEEDRSFELRMTGLMEFYLLDFPLEGDEKGRVPARLFLDEVGDELTTDERATTRALTQGRAGIFEVLKLGDGWIKLRDLIANEKLVVTERRQPFGVERGDLLQTRVIPWADTLLMGRAYIFHPKVATKMVKGVIKRRKKGGELADPEGEARLLAELGKVALQHERQQQNNRGAWRLDVTYGRLD